MTWFLYVTVAFIVTTAGASIEIETEVGTIKGVIATDGNYTSFLGIPFAEVNKENPFGVSKRYPKFEEPFEAYYDSEICPQIEEFNSTITGTLDCLQLNVYVPHSASPMNPVPVIVWIYGGAYRIGFANRFLYGPSYIVKHDVILVTINYRVGPYGFMCLDTSQVPGNQGLKDQLLGLRWVKENIQFFGGDPNQVTAFGQSVGSMSVHLHMLSPQEELFQRAIMHSGSGFTTDLIMDVDRTAPIKLAEILGFVTSDMNEALKYLATQDTDSVIDASTRIDSRFWPCLESNHEGIEKVVTDFVINQEVPKIRDKSVLLGFIEDEWLGVYANMAPENFEHLTVFHDPIKLSFTFDDDQLCNVEKILENFYLGGLNLSQEVLQGVANYQSDFIFIHPTYRCIPSFLENGAEKIFLFKFSYVGERNFVRRLNNITIGGALHTDEIGYLFDMQFIPEKPTLEDQLMIDRMTQMWTNFAKYGDPTPEISPIVPVKWQPITSRDTSYNYLNIDMEMTMGVNPFHERMSFWDLFYEGFREYQRGYKRNHASLLNRNVYLILISVYFIHILL